MQNKRTTKGKQNFSNYCRKRLNDGMPHEHDVGKVQVPQAAISTGTAILVSTVTKNISGHCSVIEEVSAKTIISLQGRKNKGN